MKFVNIVGKVLGYCSFRLKYPQLLGTRGNSAKRIKIPLLTRVGRGTRLLVTSAEDDLCGIELEKNVWIGENVELHVWFQNKLSIQSGTSVQDNCKILGDVSIGQNVIIAPNVYISSGKHYAFNDPHRLIKDQDKDVLSTVEGRRSHSRKVIIDEDVWIGKNVFIGCGVRLGKGAVIGANAVITKNITPYTVVIGSNKILKERHSFEDMNLIDCEDEKNRPYLYGGFSGLNQFIEGKIACVLVCVDAQVVIVELKVQSAGVITINQTKYNLTEGHNSLRVSCLDVLFMKKRVDILSTVKGSLMKVEVIL